MVNVASRLEEQTRDLTCRVVISDDLVQAVRGQAVSEAETLLAGFRAGGPHALRGRTEQVSVWMLGKEFP